MGKATFRLGRHSLTEASLQTVVDQCTNYNKDPWKGPVGKDGKPPRGNSSANATAGTDSHTDPYDSLASKSFNYHFGRWKKALKEQKGKCMVCFASARNEHLTCDCPILLNLGYKLEKQSPSDNPRQAASRVATEPPPTQGTTPPPVPAPPKDSQPGSAVVTGAFSAVNETSYDSGDKFYYEGKEDGAMYSADTNKSSNATYAYSPASCSHTSFDSIPEDSSLTSMGGLTLDATMGGHSTPESPSPTASQH